VGLSGLFFIVSALLMPFLEIVHTVRGRSSLSRWMVVFRHFVTALAMLAALELFYVAVRSGLSLLSTLPLRVHGALTGSDGTERISHLGQLVPVVPVLMTGCLVLCVLGLAKSAELVARSRAGAADRRLAAGTE
jgi:hypothetical protein